MRSSWTFRASARARSTSSSRPTPTSDSSPGPISPTTAPSTVTAAVLTLLTTARTRSSNPGRRRRHAGSPAPTAPPSQPAAEEGEQPPVCVGILGHRDGRAEHARRAEGSYTHPEHQVVQGGDLPGIDPVFLAGGDGHIETVDDHLGQLDDRTQSALSGIGLGLPRRLAGPAAVVVAAGLPSGGYGLARLAERVGLLGGRLDAGPTPTGGGSPSPCPSPATQPMRLRLDPRRRARDTP